MALLAGRKLLLADDSATIQKVIDLTFADEGVRVLAVGNGREAIDQLSDFAPDIVLADIHMPSPGGYEVCEYVKTNEHFKHIPVMLLVGSFEPFDEVEARRVGADDMLTKPFSSIRRLIDRVGALVSSPPVEKPLEQAATAELPKVEEPAEEPRLSTEELEITTADTLPLEGHPMADTLPRVEQPVVSESPANVTPSARLEAVLSDMQSSKTEGTSEHEGRMEPGIPETKSETRGESADVLLDLGELEPVRASAEDDEFVLDLDEDLAPAYEAAPARAPYVEPQVREAVAAAGAYESSYQPEVHSPFADTQEVPYVSHVHDVVKPERVYDEPAPAAPATSVTPDQLSPEMIDAIARRCVELMSDKVIREIAWEVVPDLAELLIKKQLEEKESQAR